MSLIKNRNLTKSYELWEEAKKLSLSGTQLYSKAPFAHIEGIHPAFIDHGKDSHVWDVDGNEYIDWEMALGPIVIGWDNERINRAVIAQLHKGTVFSQMSPIEVEYAKMLKKHVPSAEKMRFLKTGSSATEAAIRIARAYTGKEIIIRGEYHGWHEWTAAGERKRQGGILKSLKNYVIGFEYNDINQVEKIFSENKNKIAALIVEPVMIEKPKENFLSDLKELCEKNNALLIFDEVVTGFRFDIGGAQKYFNVTPHLSTFGKAMANGLPLSAVVGLKHIMDKVEDDIFISTTFGGETLSLAAGLEMLKMMEEEPVTQKIWNTGNRIKKEFNEFTKSINFSMKTIGYAPRITFDFENDKLREKYWLYKSIFMQECAKRGVLLGWLVMPCYTHTEADTDYTIEVFKESAQVIAEASESDNPEKYLEGKPTTSILG